jgi:hypothetical protein
VSNISKDKLKERIRRTSPAHEQLIDPVKNENDGVNVDVHVNENVNVNDDVNENVNVNVYVQPKVNRRPKFEDVYVRHTFFIERSLLEELNRRAAGEKGEKTRILNEALRAYLRFGDNRED